jgi:N-acetylglucosaminyldiphosphoundecaprenol N-acetyl-beta-D-mannosaminyltransferase
VWTNEHITPSGTISEYAEQPILNRPIERAVTPSRPSPKFPLAILGVPFDNVTVAQALERIDEMIASRRPHYVITANLDFCIQTIEDVEFRRILFEAHMVLCDGTPLVWASRLLGNPLPERVAGADLVPLLICRAARKGYRIFFLGGAPQVAQRAITRLQQEYPELIIAGHYSPPFRPLLDMNHGEICERIRAAQPDLLLVSFGCPKAEKWMAMHYRSLGVPVSIGVGGTIDFLAGAIRRAPEWMQRAGCEWLYRLAQEPQRLWARYARDLRDVGSPFARQLWWQRLKNGAGNDGTHAAILTSEPTWLRVSVPECFDYHTLLADASLWHELGKQHCLLDLSAVRFVDSTALATLIRLQRQIHPQRLILLSPSDAVLRVLRSFRLNDFFAIASDTIEARDIISPQAQNGESVPSAFSNLVPPLFWTGDLTAANAEEVWATTQAQIEALCSGSNAKIEIDLADLRFIDSTGIGIMIRAKRYAQSLGAILRFKNAHPNVQNVLRIARLELFLLYA